LIPTALRFIALGDKAEMFNGEFHLTKLKTNKKRTDERAD